jgi:hypothetical protein
MSELVKPPLGVMRHDLWAEDNPDQDLVTLRERFVAVAYAIRRKREAGLSIPWAWMIEVGLDELAIQ